MGEATMAEDDTDTAVADAPAGNAAAAEPDAIDALLREYEEGTKAPEQQSDPDLKAAELERQRVFNENLAAHTEGLQIDARKAELQTAAQQLQAEYDQRDAAAAF